MHCMKNLKQEATEMCVGDVEKYFIFVLTNKWGYINNKHRISRLKLFINYISLNLIYNQKKVEITE